MNTDLDDQVVVSAMKSGTSANGPTNYGYVTMNEYKVNNEQGDNFAQYK